MRIAYVITRADAVGGASVHVRDLAREMLEFGHEVLVLVGGIGPVTAQFERAGIPFRSLRFLQRSIHPVRDLRAVPELTASLRDFAPDLVSAHTAKAGWVGRAACARLGVPVVYTPHGWSIGDRVSPVQGKIFRLAEKTAAAWASAIVCVCEYERLLALDKSVAVPNQLKVIRNGVRDIPADLRATPESDPVRIVSIARFERPKDHATLFRALATLRASAWELDLVGDGPLETEMRDMARDLGIASRVRFLGYESKPERALARAQIFVLSSRSEGFPRSVLEAMRAGLPVVASNVGGVSEAVVSGVNGLLVPRGNSGALATALLELIHDASRRQRLGRAARHSYESRFELNRMVEQTIALYRTVLGENADTRRIA